MNVIPRQEQDAPEVRSTEQDTAVKAAAAWVNQLGRTLKTCRLYDANNPTVLRFRDELTTALRRMLDEHGPMTFRFTSDDVLYEEASLYPARSRDDNLALPFFRDGVRGLTFSPDIQPREVESLLDSVLHVSGQNFGEDDLVTLLWEAQLPHIEVDYIPSDSDFGSNIGESWEEGEGSLVPWPSGGGDDEGEAEEGDQPVAVSSEEADGRAGRSDDWSTGELTVEIEAGFVELDSLAPSEAERFCREYDLEHHVSQVTTALAICRAYLAAEANDEDRAELGKFIPRLLRLSVTRGAWLEAHEALGLMRACGPGEWSLGTFAQELLQPISVSTAVGLLDQQDSQGVAEFIAFARELGDPAVDWLCLVLGESQQRRVRRQLAEGIAALCRDNPERLAPFLSDRRWYMVRNVVHILGWIGGDQITGLLKAAMHHPEPRVRHEVVAALSQVDPRTARPLLLKLLEGADTRMFSAVMHQLSGERDVATARLLLGYMQAPEFEQRPQEERRAIYAALSATGVDEIVPELEAELFRGNWFSRYQEVHRQAVARCIARIGTPLARMVLERGSTSRRGPVRQACEQALMGFSHRE